ncbi:MAG: branched-chain amino acid ABC transporter substrate-binding protein [Chloroflexi bacterium]|nr:MAG: branched-chain amino acid ABC transporter substrate-binding protein [Chloroflexota bacterium]
MRRSWSRILALTMGIPLLLAILVACGSGTTGGTSAPAPAGSTTIKIATDLPTSGKDESSGKPAEDGANLAVMQANQKHTIPGYTLAFVPKDDVGPSGLHDPTVGAANVTALISDALVAGIVGPFNSSVAKAEMPIANQAPIAQISPANTNPCLTKDTDASGCSGKNNLLPTLRPTNKVNYFRIATTDDHQGPAGADYLYKQNVKKVYVIDDAETYGIGIANAFVGEWQKIGGTVLGHSSEPGTTTSYVSLLTQIATKHPDGIYFGGLDSTGGILIRQQMKQVPGLQNLPFSGGDGIVTPSFATTIQPLGGPSSYGTVAVVDTSKNPNAATFNQQYKAAFTDPENVYSAAAYDCANILIQAVKKALANGAHTPASSSDTAGGVAFRTAVIAAVQGIQYDGITGHQSFDTNGDTNLKIISIYKLGLNTSSKPDWLYEAAVNVV